MSDAVGDNLALIIGAWIALFQRGSIDALESLLDEKVVWQGMFPGEVCKDRRQVLGMLVHSRSRAPRITRIEAEENGDQVAISVDGPDFQADDRLPAGGPRSLVFTFRDGRVIRMQSLKSRDEAFRLVGRPG
jgi:SnoaL-like domain